LIFQSAGLSWFYSVTIHRPIPALQDLIKLSVLRPVPPLRPVCAIGRSPFTHLNYIAPACPTFASVIICWPALVLQCSIEFSLNWPTPALQWHPLIGRCQFCNLLLIFQSAGLSWFYSVSIHRPVLGLQDSIKLSVLWPVPPLRPVCAIGRSPFTHLNDIYIAPACPTFVSAIICQPALVLQCSIEFSVNQPTPALQ